MDIIAESKERLDELRKKTQKLNKGIPVLKEGKTGAIELNPNNPAHRDWYKGK